MSSSRLKTLVSIAAAVTLLTFVAAAIAATPVVTLTTPTEGQQFNTATPAIVYTVTDGIGPTEPVVYCNVDGPTVATTAALGATGPTGYPTCPSGAALPPQTEAGHVLNVVARNSGGELSTVTTRNFRVDLTPPTISILAPANGSTIVDESPTVSYEVAGTTNVECSFDGAAFAACGPQFESPILTEGNHSLTVRATDVAGNAATATSNFRIDFSAPLDDPPPPQAADVAAGSGKKSGKYRKYATKVEILPPADVSPTAACTGKATVSIKPKVRNAKTYYKTVKLKRKGAKCVAAGTVKLPKRYKGKRATLRLRFQGNGFMDEIAIRETITKL